VTIARNQDFNFESDDFTVEIWAYRAANTYTGSLYLYNSLIDDNYVQVGADGFVDIRYRTSAAIYNRSNVAVWPLGQWVMFAMQRVGNIMEAYLDGVLVDSVAIVGSILLRTVVGEGKLYLGRENNSSSQTWNGYIDEVRITRGVARYYDGFIPAALPNCDSTIAGEAPFTNGTEYPEGQTLTSQQGSMRLLNHYAPLQGQSVTVEQDGVGALGGPVPSGITTQYTVAADLVTEVTTSFSVIGTLSFLTTGVCTYVGGSSINNFTWLEPTGVGASAEFEVYLSVVSGSGYGYSGSIPLNTWSTVAVNKTFILTTTLVVSPSSSASRNAVINVQVRPIVSSPKYGNPYYYRNYNLTLWSVLIAL
jgi:hypothetical protein